MTWTTHQLRTDEMKANRSTIHYLRDGFEMLGGSAETRGVTRYWMDDTKKELFERLQMIHTRINRHRQRDPQCIADYWLRRPANTFLLFCFFFFHSIRVCFGVPSRSGRFHLLSLGAKFARSRLTYPHAMNSLHTARHSGKSLLFIFTANIILACCVHCAPHSIAIHLFCALCCVRLGSAVYEQGTTATFLPLRRPLLINWCIWQKG